jgi:hypothetical protein
VLILFPPAVALYVAYTNYEDCALATGFPALGDPTRFLDPSRVRLHHPFVFESITTPYQYIDTDVLVVGSGAGGGVISSQMAKKGWKTLVVEKGRYLRPDEITGTPRDGFEKLYEGQVSWEEPEECDYVSHLHFEFQGLMATEDGGVNVLAGSTFGGGTVGEHSLLLSLLFAQAVEPHLPHRSKLVRLSSSSALPPRAMGQSPRASVLSFGILRQVD